MKTYLTCMAKTQDRRTCGGHPMKGSKFCFWHGYSKKAAEQRTKATTRPRAHARTRSISGVAPEAQPVTTIQRLDEKYRPMKFRDVVGQDDAVRKLERVLSCGWGGRAIWLSGDSGTGKTTLAWIVAKLGATDADVGDHFGRIIEVVGRELSPGRLESIMHNWMFKGGHALIVNEAHGLNKVMIEIFLNVLEGLRRNVMVLFTTTNEGDDLFQGQADAAPFASRCLCLNLVSEGLTNPFAKRARDIARREHLDGKPLPAYRDLMKKYKNNLRAVLSEIEAGAMMEG